MNTMTAILCSVVKDSTLTQHRSTNNSTITKGFKALVADANAVITTLSIAEARDRLEDDATVFVDVRDEPELKRDGKIPGAIHASRGMLEFYVDPESPYYKEEFDAEKNFILYCASGGRSALAAQRLREMGLESVAHIDGGLTVWKEANGPIEMISE